MGSGTTLGGSVHDAGALNGYPENWMASTKKTIEDELRSRGIAAQMMNEIPNKTAFPYTPVLLAIEVVALLCVIIFVANWEST